MAIEQLSNAASSTLSSGVNNSVTTLPMTSVSGFSPSGNFRILVDGEIMIVTAVTGGGSPSFTVLRGQEGTAAASHSGGASVYQILTAGALQQFRADTVTSGPYASLPAAGVAGRVYHATDSPLLLIDNGSAWQMFGPVYSLTPPADASYSWLNQSNATVDTSKGIVTLQNLTGSGSAENISARVIAAPGTPYVLTACLMPQLDFSGMTQCGILLRDGAGGGMVTLTLRTDTATAQNFFAVLCMKYTNATTYAGSLYFDSYEYHWIGSYFWLRISDDGTGGGSARKFQMSRDGVHWTTIVSTSRTDFITPTQVGYYVNSYNGGVTCSFLHFVAG